MHSLVPSALIFMMVSLVFVTLPVHSLILWNDSPVNMCLNFSHDWIEVIGLRGRKAQREGGLSFIMSDLYWCHEPGLPGQGCACHLSPPWHCLSRLGCYKSSWGSASTQAGAGLSSAFMGRVHFIIWGSWRRGFLPFCFICISKDLYLLYALGLCVYLGAVFCCLYYIQL